MNAKTITRILLILILILGVTNQIYAQQPSTIFFLENSPLKQRLNCAENPERGYVSIPMLGNVNVNFYSNSLSYDALFYPKNGNLVSFLDHFVSPDEFLDRLSHNNDLQLSVKNQILGAGWYAGRNFWTFDLSFRAEMNATLPKNLFEFVKVGNSIEGTKYNFGGTNLTANAFLEASLSFSRQITRRWTIGFRPKFLVGLGKSRMMINNMEATLSANSWSIKGSGIFDTSLAGLTFDEKFNDSGIPYITDPEIDSFTPSGYGAGFDFGASYISENFDFSFSVNDLGFINWKRKDSQFSVLNGEYEFTGFDFQLSDNAESEMKAKFDEVKESFEDLFRFKSIDAKDYTTHLTPVVNMGAKYHVLNRTLGVGAYSSFLMFKDKVRTNLTAGLSFRPISWFELSASLPLLYSKFRSFGAAINFTPCWFNLIVGADYIPADINSEGVPICAKRFNVFVGMSIPFGKRHL